MKKITRVKEKTTDAGLAMSNLGVAAKNATKALKEFVEGRKLWGVSVHHDSKN